MRNSLFCILFFCCLAGSAQTTFDRVLTIPVTENGSTLRFPWAGGLNFPWVSPIDLNQDGLSDLFVFDRHNNRIQTYINNGNTSSELAWDFEPSYATQFPPVNVWAFLYDYDCDGKSDFFTFSSAFQCPGIAVYKNISPSPTTLQWQIVDSCLKETFMTSTLNIFTNSVSLPHFVDWDNDGDMDILGYNSLPNGRIIYHKNYSMEDYGVCDSLHFKLENLCLGNFQLKIGGTNTVGCFHCPCRVRRPSTQEELEEARSEYIGEEPSSDQSEAAQRDDTVSGVMAFDNDGDGNKELLIGDIASFNTLMVHNGGTEMDSQDTLFPGNDVHAIFSSFHYHAYIDLDNDGNKDMLVMANDHENKNGMWMYKNNGTTAVPVFNLYSKKFLQENMIDGGEDATPVLFDYDADGLLDIVMNKSFFDSATGGYKTGLILYKNTGSTTNPAFDLITDDFANLTAGGLYASPIYPAFGDMDNDGDDDMLIGLEDGKMHYYTNTAGPGNPVSFQGPNITLAPMDIGKYATPQLFDLDRDGLLDIVCGGQRGFLNYFKNRGSAGTPLFDAVPTIDTLGCINLQAPQTTDGYTVPFLYDSAGTTRLLVAHEKGDILQYDQIDGNLNGCFHNSGSLYHPVESSRIKFNITLSGGDLNHDSLTDIIIGQSAGGAEIRYQHNPFIGIAETLPLPSFAVMPNPVNEKLTLKFFNSLNKDAFVRIVNSLGQVIFLQQVNTSELNLNTSQWSEGVYYVNFSSGSHSIARKIIKIK